MLEYIREIQESADYILSRIKVTPEIGIILGSGLGPLAEDISEAVEIEYSHIPGFPPTSVEGHQGRLVSGILGGKPVLAMKGRFHYYEGFDIGQVVFPVRVFKLAGISNLLVSNAAGGINSNFAPGDLMLISDHIGFYAPSPLRGINYPEFGVRFPDMSEPYEKSLRLMARNIAIALGIDIKEGIYAFSQGPMYETPAEISALRLVGADAVGMSTVPEVITARHSGMRVLGISCITNMAAGISGKPLQHEEVMASAKGIEQKFIMLVKRIISEWS